MTTFTPAMTNTINKHESSLAATPKSSRFLLTLSGLMLSLALTLCFANYSQAATEAVRLAPELNKLAKGFKPQANAEAEVILRKTLVQIDEQMMSHSNAYVAVYINSDEAARDYSQISISFNSFYEDISLEFANVRTPDGKIDSIKADATQIQNPSDENFYQDRKELLFSLPNVRKGSIIEFQYTYTDTKKIIDQEWFDSFGFHWWEDRAAGQGSRADAVRYSEIEITAPLSKPLFANDLDKKLISFSTKVKGQQKIWRWEGKQLPAIELQSAMPREHSYTPYLRVSSIEHWETIAQWVSKLAEPHMKTDKKLDQLVAEISKKATTPEEKVKAVYATLQAKVRYVFAHVGRGGYEPHDAADIFNNGYGDCKDQSILATTLLRKLGIKADPALIITRSRGIPDMAIPAVSFDHMIVHIPSQPGLNEIWMDTTGDSSLYPGFSIGIEGQPALIANPNSKNISMLPTLSPAQHFAKLDLVFDKISEKNIQASFTLSLGGSYEDRMRSLWQYTPERDKYFRELLGHIYSAGEIVELSTENADNLWQGFIVKGRLNFDNVWAGKTAPINYGFNINQLLYIFADLRNLHKPEGRKQTYVVDPGYSLIAHVEFTSPGKNFAPSVKSEGKAIDNQYYQLAQKGEAKGDRYIVEQTLTIKPARVPLTSYADFYEKSQALYEDEDWTVSFNYKESTSESYAQTATGKKDAAHYIALTKLHLRNGNYAEALTSAKSAVALEPKKAETYYILGLAQGYNNLLKEADASFKKAETMGYHL